MGVLKTRYVQDDCMNARRHVSPDGKLCLIVETVDNDRSVGFEGYSWHTHGDILARLYELDAEAAIEKFIKQITNGELVIAVLSKCGNVTDIWVSDDPQSETLSAGETIQFRLWDGRERRLGMAMHLNKLESAVLEAMCRSGTDETTTLRAQLARVTVRARENTGAGFFTYLNTDRSCERLGKSVVGDVWAKIQGFEDSMTFVLFVTDGLVDTLEGATIRDSTIGTDFSAVEFEILRDPYNAGSGLR
jgi:hypothetical protein